MGFLPFLGALDLDVGGVGALGATVGDTLAALRLAACSLASAVFSARVSSRGATGTRLAGATAGALFFFDTGFLSYFAIADTPPFQ